MFETCEKVSLASEITARW